MLLRNKDEGFGLPELMLCVGILALLIIFVVTLFTRMLSAATKGGDLTVGSYLAAAQLDKLLYDTSKVSDIISNSASVLYAPVSYGPLSGDPTGAQSLNSTTFYFYFKVSNPPLVSTTAGNLYYVDAEVDWWGSAASGRNRTKADYGKLSTHLSRLIYVEK